MFSSNSTHHPFPALPSAADSMNSLLLASYSPLFPLLRNQSIPVTHISQYSLRLPLLWNHSIPCYSHSISCPYLCCGITEFPVTRILFPALTSAAESLNPLSLSFSPLSCHPLCCGITQFPVTLILFCLPLCCGILNTLVLRLCSILFSHAAPCYSDSTPCP